jgi:hypothetical protein
MEEAMKVFKSEEFKPITIILETEEEADMLWHILNVADTDSFKSYREEHRLNIGSTYPMLSRFDDVHRPEGAF